MSLDLKYDKVAKKNSDQSKDSEEKKSDDIVLYETESNVRNLCIVLADGRQVFLNYAYLISGEFFPKESTIKLIFTTHTVMIKGYALEILFNSFVTHNTKQVRSVENRYAEINNKRENLITEILLKENINT